MTASENYRAFVKAMRARNVWGVTPGRTTYEIKIKSNDQTWGREALHTLNTLGIAYTLETVPATVYAGISWKTVARPTRIIIDRAVADAWVAAQA